MKQKLSSKSVALLLALLMLASNLTACGGDDIKETETAISTDVVETQTAETNSAETDTPAPAYAVDKITENGTALAHIVLFDGADQVEKYASEELSYHIKLVSGAEIAVANTVQEGSLPIIIATPDSLPELEELFPEDFAWLRELGDGEKVRYGDDGFAIRTHEGKIYIFGATARGTLNGVYDFIEDNLGVLWTRADESIGTVYDEMPTIEVIKTDYREKSPFDLRSWTLSGSSRAHHTMLSRNKFNAMVTEPSMLMSWYETGNTGYDSIGLETFTSGHNIKWWVVNSPSYDPSCTEYWSTDVAGNHAATPEESIQVNFYSDVTMQCIADHVLYYIEKYSSVSEVNYIGICLEDFEVPYVYPEMNEPYEYAPGQFIESGTDVYLSTVYYSFLNKIARIVGERYPNVRIHTYAYGDVITPPVCEIEENLFMTFCPLGEDLCSPIGESGRSFANHQYKCLLDWMEKTPNVQVYNYYGCVTAAPFYERPIWDRIQSDLQLYVANGFNGVLPEGFADIASDWCTNSVYNIVSDAREPYLRMNNGWDMNAMTYWIFGKLAWNPNEDVDALIRYYCEKVYGDASEIMLEYYRVLQLGWNDGKEMMATEFNLYYSWNTVPLTYWDYFLNVEVDGINVVETLRDLLHQAYDAADEKGKERIRYRVEVFDNAEILFLD